MTETTGAITQLDSADHDPLGRPDLLRSCGKPYPWVEVRIVDRERRRRRRRRGRRAVDTFPSEHARLLGQRRRDREAIDDDGWFRTGDAGYRDDDGFLYLHDRVKDMIVSGGENIYPAEVENVLAKHPDVARRRGDRCARRQVGRSGEGRRRATRRGTRRRRTS